MKPRLYIVGAGPGDPALLTGRARELVENAERIWAPRRIAACFAALNPGIVAAGPGEIITALERCEGDAVALVSGDTGLFSLSSMLDERLGGRYRVEWVNGLSSVQLLCARAGVCCENIRILSLHGRPESLRRLAGLASYHGRLAVLAGSGEDVERALERLARCDIPGLEVTVGEELSMPGERVRRGAPEDLRGPFSGLSVLLVENPRPSDPHRRLRDGDFARGGVPMTKESVRSLAIHRLEVRPGDRVWDIGAGTGSVSVALALAAREGEVFAVERDGEAQALIRVNRARFGAWNLELIVGSAPDALERLPAPDAVFVGGGGAALPAVLDDALAKNPDARLLVNAVTLETLHLAVEELRRRGVEPEVECVQISRAEPAGRYHMLRAHNPVWLVGGRLQE